MGKTIRNRRAAGISGVPAPKVNMLYTHVATLQDNGGEAQVVLEMWDGGFNSPIFDTRPPVVDVSLSNIFVQNSTTLVKWPLTDVVVNGALLELGFAGSVWSDVNMQFLVQSFDQGIRGSYGEWLPPILRVVA